MIKYFILVAAIHGVSVMDKDVADAVRERVFSSQQKCEIARLAMRGWFDEHHPTLADKYTARCEPDGIDL